MKKLFRFSWICTDSKGLTHDGSGSGLFKNATEVLMDQIKTMSEFFGDGIHVLPCHIKIIPIK